MDFKWSCFIKLIHQNFLLPQDTTLPKPFTGGVYILHGIAHFIVDQTILLWTQWLVYYLEMRNSCNISENFS